jgi:hypothetical protein
VIFFGLPLYGANVIPQFIESLMHLQESLILSGVPHKFSYVMNESGVHRVRNQLSKSFLEGEATHLMFIDSDMGFSAEDVGRLYQMDADIAVGVYRMKKDNSEYAAWVNGELLTDLPDDPIEVDFAGTGFMLIKRGVFESLDVPEEATPGGKRKRFFSFEMDGDVELPEDYNFCKMAREKGFKVMMNPAVKLIHYGIKGY